MAWLSGYGYRKKGVVNSTTAGAQTNYQLKLIVGESSGASGTDIHCENHCLDFPNDIRFTKEDKVSKHDYWVEKLEGTTPNQKATVWIEIASVPASGSVDFYIYYRRSSDDGESNGDNAFEFFDDFDEESSNAWTQLADIPETKAQHGFEELNGILYAVCGETGDPLVNTNTMYAYDISGNTWSQKANAPVSIQSAAFRAVNGKLYLIGGNTGPTFINKTYEYTPGNDTWVEKADMPTAREDMGSAVVNGKIYVFGGLVRNGVEEPTNKMEVYDPVANSWETKANLPGPRWSGDFGCAYNGKIYIISGSDVMSDLYPYLYPITTVYEYNPSSDTYTQKADIPTGRCYKEVEELNGKVYVMAGATSHVSMVSNKNEVYDVATNTWAEKVPTPYWAYGPGLTKYNGKLYFSGGNSEYHGLPKTCLYRLDDPTAGPELTKWNITDAGGSYSLANSTIALSGLFAEHAYSITGKNGFSPNIALRAKSKLETTAESFQITRLGWSLNTGCGAVKDGNDLQSVGGTHYAGCGDGTDYGLTDIGATHFGDWYTYDIIRLGTSTKFYKNGGLINDCPYDLNGNRYAFLYARDSEYQAMCDWILIRKYASPEPTWGSWSDEYRFLISTEAGSGADALSQLLSALSKSDQGAGTEALAALINTPLDNDTGSGADSLTSLSASISQSDSGAGAESLRSRLFGSSDQGAGVDADIGPYDILLLEIGDSVLLETGDEVLLEEQSELLATLLESDSGAGVDALIAVINTVYGSEIGTGAESLTPLLAAITKSDTGSGLESLGSRLFGSSDSGAGVDTLWSMLFGFSDSGAGVDELISVAHFMFHNKSDFGIGADAHIEGSKSLSQSDSGIGTESTIKSEMAVCRGFFYSKLGFENLNNPPKTSFSITTELNNIASFNYVIQNDATNRAIIANNLTEDFKIMRDDDTELLRGSIDSDSIEYFTEGEGGGVDESDCQDLLTL